uniref:Uncharacterized protein n=1 Tax=Arundo donax TaxID=35708 RepID=A0A0A9AED0_ARUDO
MSTDQVNKQKENAKLNIVHIIID